MLHLTLYSFIVSNLVKFNVHEVAVFHCASKAALQPLAQRLAGNYIFAQYIDLEQPPAIRDFDKRFLGDKSTKLGVFLNLSCSQSPYIIKQSSKLHLYTQHFHWLLFDQTGNLAQLERFFGSANLGINADISYISLAEHLPNASSSFMLYDVYNKGSHLGGQLNISKEQLVSCNLTACQVVGSSSLVPRQTRLQQRSNLTGITFRIAAVIIALPLNSSEAKLLSFLNSDDAAHLDWLSRMGYRVIKHMQELLHFNMSYVWLKQWSINDSIGGAMGELANQTVELSTTPFTLSAARLRMVQPLGQLSQFRSICIFRTPHNAGIKANTFLAPFMPSVWCVFGLLLLACGMLLWFIFRLEQRWLQLCWQYMPSLLTSCLLSFGAACSQSSYLLPRSIGGRLAFMALMLISFLMYNYYTSVVVSILLGSPVRSNIKTIQQLADSSLDIGFQPLPFTQSYLESSPRPDIRSLVKQKIETKRDPNSIWLSAREGVLKVRNQPGFVFVSEVVNLYHFVELLYRPHEICNLNEISFRPESNVFAIIHRNSSYRELLKQVYFRMMESGIVQKHRRYFVKSKLHCYNNNFIINVGMEYTAPLFISLAISYIMALLVLLMELIWKRFGASCKRRLRRVVSSKAAAN